MGIGNIIPFAMFESQNYDFNFYCLSFKNKNKNQQQNDLTKNKKNLQYKILTDRKDVEGKLDGT